MVRKMTADEYNDQEKQWAVDGCREDDKGCWIWQRAYNKKVPFVITRRNSQNLGTRYMYELFYGELPQGSFIAQTCGDRRCMNPRHLTATTFELAQDMYQ